MNPRSAWSTKNWSELSVKGRTAWLQWIMLIVVGLAIAVPRLKALNRLVTPDEHLWLARSANFYMAISQGKLEWTYLSEHPGLTVMWAGTGGFLVRYPQYRHDGPDRVDSNEFNRYIQNAKGVSALDLLVASRVFMILGHTLVLLVSFCYAIRIISPFPALISFLLIAFEPYHVALTRVLHLDGLLGNMLLLSLLAIISFLQGRRTRDLLVSAIAAGLGLLTKSPGILIVPVVGLLTLFALRKDGLGKQERSIPRLIGGTIRISAIWGLVLIITFVALWPAMWVSPIQTIRTIVVEGWTHYETESKTPRFFNGEIFTSDQFGIKYWYFYPITFLFRSSPVVLFGLILSAWAILKKRHPFESSNIQFVLLSLLLFIGVFTAAMATSDIQHDRYLLPIFAPFDIIAGLGWSSLILSWSRKTTRGYQRYAAPMVALLIIAFQGMLSLSVYPYYFPYYNPLLGGARKAQVILHIGWGEGLDQAAQYLNKKPKAGQLEVVSYYASGCFSYYFNGRTREVSFAKGITDDDWQKFLASDYVVVYINQRQRKIASPILDYVADLTPEYTVWINGLDYAQVYKIHE